MAIAKPRLFANQQGVWCERIPDRPSGIEWGEIYRVTAHKINGVTKVVTCVVLDFEFGEFIELCDDWPGFVDAIEAITKQLSGIEPAWYQEVKQLGIAEPVVEVWHR